MADRQARRRAWHPGWRPRREAEPTVFTMAGSPWAGWTLPRLLETCAASRVPFTPSTGSPRQLSLARACAAVASCRRSQSPYVDGWAFGRDKALRGKFKVPGFAKGDPLAALPPRWRPHLLWIYYGGRGSGSRLHRDVLATHGWLVVLSGCKEWVLYPPDAQFHDPTAFDAFAPRARALDRKADRKRWTATVGPNDLIYVPSMWWHQVRNLEPTLAVTGNFVHAVNAQLAMSECVRLGYGRYADRLARHYDMRPGAESDG